MLCIISNKYQLIIFGLKYEFVYIHVLKKSLYMCLLPKIVKARKVDRALRNVFCIVTLSIVIYVDNRGGSRGGASGAPPPNFFFEKIGFFGVKS